jgi:hypothetical protein
MKTRNITVLIAVLTLFVLTIAGSFVLSRPASAQKNDKTQNLTNQTSFTKFSENENKAKNQVPDKVAYELFLRTIGEYNAKGLVERGGFNESEVEIIVGEAKSLNEALVSNEESARKLKENKVNLLASDFNNQLTVIQTRKGELIDRTVSNYLPGSLKNEGTVKLKNFIDTEVKNNITVVLKSKSEKDEISFVKTSTKSLLQSSGGKLYLYSSAWRDGANVFGAGTLSEQYQSNTSYHVTTTVTSPSGRSNTTNGDWNYAMLSNNAGLSLGTESGSYSVQATFEADSGGYFDEWGNYYSSGVYPVGSSTNSVLVRPLISVSGISGAITFSRTTGSPRVGTANISLSADIGSLPLPVCINVELNRQSGDIFYTAKPNQGVNPPDGRLITIRHNSPGDIVGAGFTFTPTLSYLSAGTAVEQFRISSVRRVIDNNCSTELAAGTDFDYGTRNLNLGLSIPASQTSGGGGSGSCVPATGYGYTCPMGFGSVGGGSCCQYASPLLLDIDGDGYEMTDYYSGVPFDVAGKGYATQTSWTATNSDDAWLVLDRNENSRVDGGMEMFGDASEQAVSANPRNGFASLAMFDTTERGGNADGKITRRDTVFRKLRAWQDRNHNGISEPEELSRLPALDVVAIFLDYRESRRTDEYGNSNSGRKSATETVRVLGVGRGTFF